MAAPRRFAEHLRKEGYDSRSSEHSNVLMELVVQDLVKNCNAIGEAAARGELVYKVNHTAYVMNEDWKLDLAIGPPSEPVLATGPGQIPEQKPAAVRLAVEAKSIFTKHTGQRKNRRRDIGAFRDFMDNYDPNAVRAAITVVNMATRFRSPLPGGGTTEHPNIERIVEEIGTMFRNVILRAPTGDRGTVDANCLIVVEYDNIDRSKTVLVTRKPAPQEGDPLHYRQFLQKICDAFERRWAGR